jgi:hypothetical protein
MGQARLTAAAKTDIDNSVLCWLATIDEDGVPNVSPKEIFTYQGDDRIIIADIASPKSVANVRSRPPVCVSFVDVFRQRGFKVKGHATVMAADDPRYPEAVENLGLLAGSEYKIRSVIAVTVERVSRLWAPSYLVYPDRTDRERLETGYRTYGVKPLLEDK